MYKKAINNPEMKEKQSQVCELISKIWDAEALDIILGSVQNIIKIKKLVMMVDASCGSSQIYTQPPIEVQQSEDEEDIDGRILSDSDSDAGEHILVESSPPFTQLATQAQTQPIFNEEGEYLTQIICDTPAPPRITIVEEPEDNEWDSLFGDINFESEEESLFGKVEEEENDNEETLQRTITMQRAVADYMSTPLEQINAQCPYFLTRQEAVKLFGTDFSPIKEVHNIPEAATCQRSHSPLTQTTKDIIQAARELETQPIPEEVSEEPKPHLPRVDRDAIQATMVSASEKKKTEKRKRRQATEEERQIKRARKVQKAATKAANNVGASKNDSDDDFEIDFTIQKNHVAPPTTSAFKKPDFATLRKRGYPTKMYDEFRGEGRGLDFQKIKDTFKLEMSRHHTEEKVTRTLQTDLRYIDLVPLQSQGWYQDNVIDSYFELLQERSAKKTSVVPSLEVLITKFYTKLVHSGYKGVKRWRENRSIFTSDLVLMPVNIEKHWSLLAFHIRARTVTYYCSLRLLMPNVLVLAKDFVVNEAEAKNIASFNVDDWTFKQDITVPQQPNGFDCGAALCMFAEHLSRRTQLPKKMPASERLRAMQGMELLRSELFYY